MPTPKQTNLFTNLPSHLPTELFTTILAANVYMERIVSHGHVSPEGFWFDQDQHEWVIVLKGAAKLDRLTGNAAWLRRCVGPTHASGRSFRITC